MKQVIVTLDLEGVLVPEIWIAVAEKTGIPELRRTTRDEPDYDKLMRSRLEILDRHGLKLSDIQQVIGTLKPLDGALEFVRELRANYQLIILSDTFAFHPLAVGDARADLHYPKIEAYDGYLYAILHGMHYEASDEEFATHDIDFFV